MNLHLQRKHCVSSLCSVRCMRECACIFCGLATALLAAECSRSCCESLLRSALQVPGAVMAVGAGPSVGSGGSQMGSPEERAQVPTSPWPAHQQRALPAALQLLPPHAQQNGLPPARQRQQAWQPDWTSGQQRISSPPASASGLKAVVDLLQLSIAGCSGSASPGQQTVLNACCCAGWHVPRQCHLSLCIRAQDPPDVIPAGTGRMRWRSWQGVPTCGRPWSADDACLGVSSTAGCTGASRCELLARSSLT